MGTLRLALGGAGAAIALFAGVLLAAWLRPGPDSTDYSRGTAFRVGQDGLWVTAAHVVAACRAAPEIVSPSGRALTAEVRRIDPVADLALLATGTQDEPLQLRIEQVPQRRDIAHAVGFARDGPVGLAGAYVVTAPRSVGETGQEALRSIWVARGRAPGAVDSLDGIDGGPLVDAQGAVVGVFVSPSVNRDLLLSATGAQIAALLEGHAIRKAAPLPPVERRVEEEDLAGLRDRLVGRGFVRPIRCAVDGAVAAASAATRKDGAR
jgi:hypothetical protein